MKIEAGDYDLLHFATTGHFNKANPLFSRLDLMKSEQDDERFSEWAHILFDQALLAEGGQLEDPGTFVKRLNKLLLQLSIR